MAPSYARAKEGEIGCLTQPGILYLYLPRVLSRGGTWLEAPGIKRKSDIFIPASKNYSLVETG